LIFICAIRKATLRVALLIILVAVIGAASTKEDETPPAILKIGDTSFKVQVERFPDSYVGMTYFEKKVIQIDPSSASTLRRKVYLHELMHVAWHKGKLPFDESQTYTEDEAIEALVPGLLQILEENPDAVEYLQRRKSARAKTVAGD
jgi:IrrE N-terminal-like domain